MRNLTLGALIVSVGTLAALPFRRSAPSEDLLPNRSIHDTETVVSPANDTTDLVNCERTANDRSARAKSFVTMDPVAKLEAEIKAIDAFAHSSSPAYSWNRPNEPMSPHRTLKPLTYEDLAVPLTRPPIIQERFNATQVDASAPQTTDDSIAMATDHRSRMQPLTINDFEHQRVQAEATPVAIVSSTAKNDSGQNAKFASSPARQVEPVLPTPSEPRPERERFWIRQP